jgi:hypothetical protein
LELTRMAKIGSAGRVCAPRTFPRVRARVPVHSTRGIP